MKEGGGFSFASFNFVLNRLLLQAIVYRAQNFRTIEARCLYRPEVYSAQVFDTVTEAFDARVKPRLYFSFHATTDAQNLHFFAFSLIVSRHSKHCLVGSAFDASAFSCKAILVMTKTASDIIVKSTKAPARCPYLMAFTVTLPLASVALDRTI